MLDGNSLSDTIIKVSQSNKFGLIVAKKLSLSYINIVKKIRSGLLNLKNKKTGPIFYCPLPLIFPFINRSAFPPLKLSLGQ